MIPCQHCGGPCPPRKTPGGHPQKWCSERCRKRQYDRECSDCGARISGTSPGKAGGRCADCAHYATRGPRPETAAFRKTIETLWAQGKTQREICAHLGVPYKATNTANWRARGFDLPHRRTPEQIARITADADAHLAKARRVWNEMRKTEVA